MRSSGLSIDYALRPAKAVERHILADFISLTMKLRPTSKYRYFGMGSYAFKDFILYNQLFGFEQLTSAEHDVNLEKRCRFNRPAPNVHVKIGAAGDALEKLRWDKAPYVVWLDYDGQFNESIYDDLQTVATNIQPGSMLAITLNAHYSIPTTGTGERSFLRDRRREFRAAVIRRQGLSVESFNPGNAASSVHAILSEHIQHHVKASRWSSQETLLMDSTALLQYRDNARMMTSVFICHRKSDSAYVAKLKRASNVYEFCRKFPYKLEVPLLTSRERRHLERSMSHARTIARSIGIQPASLKDFAQIARYWPYFGEVDV